MGLGNGTRDHVKWGLVAAALLATALIAGDADAQGQPALWRTIETRSSDLSIFPRWTRALAGIRTEMAGLDQPCEPTATNRCQLQQWRQFLESLRGHDPMTQIVEINNRMNSAPYIEDIMNWGVTDYWATPGEFFNRSGDCEDFAIAKFMSLRYLGFTNEQLRIAVVQDTNLNLVHAVLIVYFNGQALVLDNQVSQVVTTDSVPHYVPYYTVNESYWWMHTQ